ncbi:MULTISPECIES: hypothetical protein [Actinomycetes]|nr:MULTISPECIES: hypothetical protein [Actinomycetes]
MSNPTEGMTREQARQWVAEQKKNNDLGGAIVLADGRPKGGSK